MAVEKGQKYKYKGYTNGSELEIVSDPFTHKGNDYVVYWFGHLDLIKVSALDSSYTLIREPKFKVGDQVTYSGAEHEVVAVSEKTDLEGDFGYLVLDSNGYFNLFDDSCGLKAAE